MHRLASALTWDLGIDPFTLGGALVLRMEGEMLASSRRTEGAFPVYLSANFPPAARDLVTSVFASSQQPFLVLAQPAPDDAWPPSHDRTSPGFSYYSYARVLRLYAELGLPPRLAWAPALQAEASQIRQRFPGRLMLVHLRSVPPFAVHESNAEGAVWGEFLASVARPGEVDFLLLGDDPLPLGFTLPPGVTRAKSQGITLMEQLALVAYADGYLGMASGLGCAADFSATPHVIFKHPAHHAAAMQRELCEADQFPFYTPHQRLLRTVVDVEALHSAWRLLA